MLFREGKIEIALSQIEQGIAINPRKFPRILLHTKGTILGASALQAESIDIGRRHLLQAEDVLRNSIRLNSRDAYPYQSLANLYLDWAKKSTEESTVYVTKAEEAVSEGLLHCRDKDRLWIVSSAIEQWLGNQPSQLKALERAVEESPGSIIARYLLGKEYHRLERYPEALAVLEPNIHNHPEEFRSFIIYALSMIASGKHRRESIAVLEVASVEGLSDMRYIAHLGGMHFLNGDFEGASKVFAEVSRRELPPSERHSIFFIPRQHGTGKTIELTGKVFVRHPRYSLIESEGYPRFFCHSSKHKGLTLKDGMLLSFEVGFSASGATALNPKVIT